MPGAVRNHGLGLFFAAIFVAALVGQAFTGHADYNDLQVAHHDDPLSLGRYRDATLSTRLGASRLAIAHAFA